MTTVTVRASIQYDILIGHNLLKNLGTEIKKLGGAEKICVVSETTVFPLYGEMAVKSLEGAGFQVVHFIFPAGESGKNGGNYLNLLNFLAENRFCRKDMLVALGGGVPGDLAGFAAATYCRGIRFVQVPTTLLAAVDSSIGGKTAIDLPAGKNLAGAFHQPSLVLCDLDTLDSLPREIFADGCAEVIKYAVLFDPELFSLLEKDGLLFDRETVIRRCVEMKRDVVARDEFDRGERMLLNLGHTLGHGVEALSDFSVSHGKAVAMGLAIIARAAASLGKCSAEAAMRICTLIGKFGLPVNTAYTAEELVLHARSDKKSTAQAVDLIVPYDIGRCGVEKTGFGDLKTMVEKGL